MFGKKKTPQQKAIDFKIYLESNGFTDVTVIGDQKKTVFIEKSGFEFYITLLDFNTCYGAMIDTYNSLSVEINRADFLESCNSLNDKNFFLKYRIDEDGDLNVSYVMRQPEDTLFSEIVYMVNSCFIPALEELAN